jgi:hypothetical protein
MKRSTGERIFLWFLVFLTVLLLMNTLNTCEANAMQPLPLNSSPDARVEHVEQEPVLVASMQKGKVNIYRVVDTELQVVCYVTIGELHGKTVAQNCFTLMSLGTMWFNDKEVK